MKSSLLTIVRGTAATRQPLSKALCVIMTMKNNPKFEVEAVTAVEGRGVLVFAKYLGAEDFIIQKGLELNGCKISSGNIPRALDKNGNPRFDLWGFQLERAIEKNKFIVGEVVELTQ